MLPQPTYSYVFSRWEDHCSERFPGLSESDLAETDEYLKYSVVHLFASRQGEAAKLHTFITSTLQIINTRVSNETISISSS